MADSPQLGKELVERSDLWKLHDALLVAEQFFTHRDVMNTAVYLAKKCRYSPITRTVRAALDRIKNILEQAGERV